MFRDAMKLCPACGAELMERDRRWRCDACGGVLVRVADVVDQLSEEAPVLEIAERARNITTWPRRLRPGENVRACPTCGRPMDPVFVSDVPIERCDTDGMLWFDGGEYGALLQNARTQDRRERGFFRRLLNVMRR